MPRKNKIAFGILLVAVCVVLLGLIWAVSAALGLFGVAIGAAEAGFGLRDALLVSIPIALAVILLLALVAGDGLAGELGVMLIGFFVLLIFSTVAIAFLL